MKKMMSRWAEKLMERAHKAIREYERGMGEHRDLPPAKQMMLYGRYLADMNEAL